MYDNAILKIIFRRELFSSRTYFKEKKRGFSGAFVIEKDSIKSVFFSHAEKLFIYSATQTIYLNRKLLKVLF